MDTATVRARSATSHVQKAVFARGAHSWQTNRSNATPGLPQCTDCFAQHRTTADRTGKWSKELKKERLCRLGESKHQLNIDPDNPQYCTLGKTINNGYWNCWCSHLRDSAMASTASATGVQWHMLLLAMISSPLKTHSIRSSPLMHFSMPPFDETNQRINKPTNQTNQPTNQLPWPESASRSDGVPSLNCNKTHCSAAYWPWVNQAGAYIPAQKYGLYGIYQAWYYFYLGQGVGSSLGSSHAPGPQCGLTNPSYA